MTLGNYNKLYDKAKAKDMYLELTASAPVFLAGKCVRPGVLTQLRVVDPDGKVTATSVNGSLERAAAQLIEKI